MAKKKKNSKYSKMMEQHLESFKKTDKEIQFFMHYIQAKYYEYVEMVEDKGVKVVRHGSKVGEVEIPNKEKLLRTPIARQLLEEIITEGREKGLGVGKLRDLGKRVKTKDDYLSYLYDRTLRYKYAVEMSNELSTKRN